MSLRKQLFKLCDELFEKKNENTKEIFPKKSALLFAKKDLTTDLWYLYQINIISRIENTGELGFIVPAELIELPKYNDGLLTVNIVYRKTIHCGERRDLFEQFSKHIFENVFNSSMFEFNIQRSTFKLLPCLLTSSNDIDYNRMLTICRRHQKSIEHDSHLLSTELYTLWCDPTKPLFIHSTNVLQQKRASDRKTSTQTYADYYETFIPNIRIQRNSNMGSMKVINKIKISLNTQENLMQSTDQTIYYYPVELLHYAPLNQRDFELISKLPSILVRLVQLYHLERLRILFAENIKCYSLMRSNEVNFQDCLTEYMQIVSCKNCSIISFVACIFLVSLNRLTYDFSNIGNHLPHEQPSIDILFQAITRRSANEQVDMENFEILGDCFLKFSVSMSLYYCRPSANAGQLTIEKAKEISNENLYRIAVEKKLNNHLYCDKILFHSKDSNWLPPGYIVKRHTETKYTHQIVKRKAFADMIEAFIGAYLISSNYMTTIKFMHWLGLNVIPLDQNDQIVSVPQIIAPELDREISRIFHDEGFHETENKLSYVFQNKAYLISAFTHPSKHCIAKSYERLEFLGDALLDLLIIRHTFLNYDRNVTPGRVTDIRQDLSNNNRLAYILVSSDLHIKIRHNSNPLTTRIQSYVNNRNIFPENPSSTDIHQSINFTAPKILADVFEALIAAIFLDCDNSLETVWKVIEPFLGKFVDRSIVHPHLNPSRSFADKGGEKIAEFTDETGAVCVVRMPDGTFYEGHGKNKKLAKSDACQQAVNHKN